MKKDFKYREIPYNYTSFSDKEIVLKYFDQEAWEILDYLRHHRVTGRSAKLFFDLLGDIFIIDRNPYIFNEFLENTKKQKRLKKLHIMRLDTIEKGTDKDIVLTLIKKTRIVDRNFFNSFEIEINERRRIKNYLGKILPSQDISFSAFNKVSHVTDATDWRVEYPKAVVFPNSSDEIIDIIKAAKHINCCIIPRGGGTGLTGGVIPVMKNTIIVNTEKLRNIYPVQIINENNKDIPVIEVDAGAITESVMEFCKSHGYIFATDPTSAWASTIGGNIAENSGGKKAVIWGTAIDNIYSFNIVNSDGDVLKVKRRDHPYRKIHYDDIVIFDVFKLGKKNDVDLVNTIVLKGGDIRKKGVGKDITNKALGGLPGIQKEGGDGIIISAVFVLYRPFTHIKTLCLEFFGKNLLNASKAIVDVLNLFDQNGPVFLTALEHFDEKYVIAINYRNKSKKSGLPKAVLLVDVESNDEKELAESCDKILLKVTRYDCDGFIATDEKTRDIFWKDRKNLGAIAKHTNAFKLNEDVVIPIEALPDFAEYIERLNSQKELENNISITNELLGYIRAISNENDSYVDQKRDSSIVLLQEFNDFCRTMRDNINEQACTIEFLELDSQEKGTVFSLIRDGIISIQIVELQQRLIELFHGYDEVTASFDEIIKERKSKQIIIATHMHAGDGNIHVNIPVHSNDYSMLMEADETAGMILNETKRIGGVISGEHGIGLTKLPYIDQEILDEYKKYKEQSDPNDIFNPGKLRSDFPKYRIYTPSMNLLEMEAFILEAADLFDLTTSISACVRCGKCKEVCNTHYPKGTMYFNPRNKILGVSLIIEAVLYESQTSNTLSFHNFRMLREISNHCTMCHNCSVPCPVKIDFGEVTLSVRSLLKNRKKAKFKLITWVTLYYLRKKGYYTNLLFRLLFLKIGYTLQRIGYYFNKPFKNITLRIMPKVGNLLLGKFPKSGKKSIREIFSLNWSNSFYSFSKLGYQVVKNVIYFPGCGSERLFPEISLAVIALLYNAGVRVVIPPEYLCCGYPFIANGNVDQADIKSFENRVIFHRMAALLGYMDIEDVLISCGTCREMLNEYQIDNIFPDSSIIDINEFLMREQLYSKQLDKDELLYHKPCHSPLQKEGEKAVFKQLLGTRPRTISNCCGEGGTLALSTPDISNVLRIRKNGNILMEGINEKNLMIISTCPSCIQGLSKIKNSINVTGKSLVVFLAEQFLGKKWEKAFIRHVKKNSGCERIIY